MEKNRTLLDGAKADLKVSEIILSQCTDDLSINLAAYHLQQALEKALKFRINMLGEKYPMTHNIERLVEILTGLGDEFDKWLIESAGLITEYEHKSRYIIGYVTSKNKIQSFMKLTECLIEKFEPEISEIDREQQNA